MRLGVRGLGSVHVSELRCQFTSSRWEKWERWDNSCCSFFLVTVRSQLTVFVLVSYMDSSCSLFLVARRSQLTVIVLVSSATFLLHLLHNVFFLSNVIFLFWTSPHECVTTLFVRRSSSGKCSNLVKKRRLEDHSSKAHKPGNQVVMRHFLHWDVPTITRVHIPRRCFFIYFLSRRWQK